jgi:hypothetical protein
MTERGQGQFEKIVPFAPTPKDTHPNDSDVVDSAGQTILGLLQQAANAAQENCQHALGVAHKLSLQLRAAEDHIKELETDLRHYQDRALRAENWLQRISREIENRFFEPKETGRPRQDDRQTPSATTRRP